jgi:hypothetical protein
MPSGSPPPGRQSGITYLAVLFFVAASSAMLAAVGTIWSHERQRQKEEELIWIGNQFRQAIALYYHRSPGTVKRYPAKLEDLLEDHRHLNVARYLRRIYRDPLTGKAEWGLIPAPSGGIMGVHSLSHAKPVKSNAVVGGGPPWQFSYQPPPAPSGSGK